MKLSLKVAFRLAAWLVFATSAYAHNGEKHATPAEKFTAWNWDPLILTILSLSLVFYIRGIVRLRRHSDVQVIPRWQQAAFGVGWLVLFASLISPMHRIGAALFSVHMTQHELLMLVTAPLLVMGRPMIAFLWAFPKPWRTRLAGGLHERVVAGVWRMFSAPVVVWVLHAIALWMWHIPSLYEAAVESQAVHLVQHAMFLGTAALFWWTLIHGRYGRLGYGAAVLFVFTTSLHSGILGALLTLNDRVWFAIHEGRTAAWNLTPLEDQQLAGLIMWIPAGVIFLLVGLGLLAAWLGESERRLALSRLADAHEVRQP